MSTKRVVINFSSSSLSNVVTLGRYHYTQAQNELAPHSHADQIEICYLSKGKQIYQVQGEQYRLSGNDIFVTFPGEVHSTGGFPEEKGVLYWIICRVSDDEPSFLHYDGKKARELLQALQNIPARHFKGSAQLQEYLDRAIACWENKQNLMDEIHVGHNVLAFVLEVLRCSGREKQNNKSLSIQKAISYIESNLDEPVEIKDLAEVTGLSNSWFKVKFKKEMGVTPGDYVMRNKIEQAKEYISFTEMNITDVAFSLAFSSSQYFATVFKKYTGCTPSEYRDKH